MLASVLEHWSSYWCVFTGLIGKGNCSFPQLILETELVWIDCVKKSFGVILFCLFPFFCFLILFLWSFCWGVGGWISSCLITSPEDSEALPWNVLSVLCFFFLIQPVSKIGSRAPQTQTPVTYREAKTLLHCQYNRDWKKDNGGYQAHLDPIWRLERAQETTIFCVRTGHCGLSAHLKRIGISDTSLCECGQADQTPNHVLQSCPKYAEKCPLTWPQGADLTTKLWGSA